MQNLTMQETSDYVPIAYDDTPGPLPRQVGEGTTVNIAVFGETLLITGTFEHSIRVDGLMRGPADVADYIRIKEMEGFWEAFVDVLWDDLADPILDILNATPSPLTGLIRDAVNRRLAQLEPGPWKITITRPGDAS